MTLPSSSAWVDQPAYETTQKVITQQRLQEKAEQLEFALAATELGTWDADLETEVSNVIRVYAHSSASKKQVR